MLTCGNVSVSWRGASRGPARLAIVTAFTLALASARPAAAGSLTPYSGSPQAVPGTIQAADFDNGGRDVAYGDTTTGNLGGAYRSTDVDIEPSSEGGYDVGWIDPNEWLNYTVAVASSGTYTVQLRIASPNGGSLHIGLNGSGFWQSVSLPATGGWQNWTTVQVPASLTAGQQVMTLVFDSGGFNVRYIKLVSGSTTTPTGTGVLAPFSGTPQAIPGQIQAADFDQGGSGVAYRDTTSGNSGGAYRSTDVDLDVSSEGRYYVGWTAGGEWLKYSVNVAASGSYSVQLRTASASSGGSLHVGFDRSGVSSSVSVPVTGGWQNWTTVSVPVTLTAGTQVMTLQFDSGGFNVSYVKIVTATAAPTDTTSSTPTSGTIDPSWVQLYPGDNIQNLVNMYPGATTFYLRAGVFHRQRIAPKSGDRFIGEAGAVLDGDGVTPHAFDTLTSTPGSVRIEGLEIRNYVPPSSLAAIQGDNGGSWVITGNTIHDNANIGIRIGPRTQVLNNKVYRNGLVGLVAYKADTAVIDGNELYSNNPNASAGSGIGAGMKVTGCHDLSIRNNYVHHNTGKGIWSDTNYPTMVIESNHVTDNTDAGIWHEISYDAVIRNNTVERNGGTTAPSWLQRAGITVSNSPNVQVYGNTILDNANGIGVMYASGYASSGPYGAYIVQNLSVHDNVVRMAIGRTGLATNTGDTSIYTSRNNHFEHDTYYLGANSTYFMWKEYNDTEAQWMAAGNDDTGTFNR